MKQVTLQQVEPTFGMEDQFVIADLQSIFISDSLETSRPLHFEVSDPKIINNYFDGVAYSKGDWHHILYDEIILINWRRTRIQVLVLFEWWPDSWDWRRLTEAWLVI